MLDHIFELISASLNQRQEIPIIVPPDERDSPLVCDWISKIVKQWFPDANCSRLELNPTNQQYIFVVSPSSDNERLPSAAALQVPELDFCSQMRVLASRRWEVMMHHGVIVTRRALREALQMASASAQQARIANALDLVDESLLSYRQSLLNLAKCKSDLRCIEVRFTILSQALGGVYSDHCKPRLGGVQPQTQLGQPASVDERQLLQTACRNFNEAIASLGGPNNAAVVSHARLRRSLTS